MYGSQNKYNKCMAFSRNQLYTFHNILYTEKKKKKLTTTIYMILRLYSLQCINGCEFCSCFIAKKKKNFGNLFYDFRLTALFMMNWMKGCLGVLWLSTMSRFHETVLQQTLCIIITAQCIFIIHKLNTQWIIFSICIWWRDFFMHTDW